MIIGKYYFLDENMEKNASKYECQYIANDKNEIDVSCLIKSGPEIISNGRTVKRIVNPLENEMDTFYGVRGFSFRSKNAKSDMPENEIRNNLSDEIHNIFDFMRDPPDNLDAY